MHLTILLNNLGIKGSNFLQSQTSITSSNSYKNTVSFVELAKGQYLRIPSNSGKAKEGSFDKKSIEHLINYSWYRRQVCTLCKGTITFLKNITCSSLRGTAKPLIIAARISNNSAAPANL